MKQTRKIGTIIHSKPTIEGAGVHLKRAFGFHEVPQLRPVPAAGRLPRPTTRATTCPASPGTRTAASRPSPTCSRARSSTATAWATAGVIAPGDVQWMTAGSGIIHQEMPQGDARRAHGGFQLWANLPRSHKMMDPRYRDVRREQIPEVTLDGGAKVKVVCGTCREAPGPGHGHRHRPGVPGRDRAGRRGFRPRHQARPHRLRLRDRRAPATSTREGRPDQNGSLCLFEDGDRCVIAADGAGALPADLGQAHG